MALQKLQGTFVRLALCATLCAVAQARLFGHVRHAQLEEIVHGSHVKSGGDYPWYGVLLYRPGEFDGHKFVSSSSFEPQAFCGGSLLQSGARTFMLTAGHCVFNEEMRGQFNKAPDQGVCSATDANCVKYLPASPTAGTVHVDFKRVSTTDRGAAESIRIAAVYLNNDYAKCESLGKNRFEALKVLQLRQANMRAVARLMADECARLRSPEVKANAQRTHQELQEYVRTKKSEIFDLALDCDEFEDASCNEITAKEKAIMVYQRILKPDGDPVAQLAEIANDIDARVDVLAVDASDMEEEIREAFRIASVGCSSDMAVFELAWAPTGVDPVSLTTAVTPADAVKEDASQQISVIGFGRKQNWSKSMFGRVKQDPVVDRSHPRGVEYMSKKSTKLRKGRMNLQSSCSLPEFHPKELLFCMRGFGDISTAQTTGSGDSGGPVFVETGSGTILIGAVTAGVNIAVDTPNGRVTSKLSDPFMDSFALNLSAGSVARRWIQHILSSA